MSAISFLVARIEQPLRWQVFTGCTRELALDRAYHALRTEADGDRGFGVRIFEIEREDKVLLVPRVKVEVEHYVGVPTVCNELGVDEHGHEFPCALYSGHHGGHRPRSR